MNDTDCIWWWIRACEELDMLACNQCLRHVKNSSEQGRDIFEKYSDDVELALEPVKEKWQKVMLSEEMMRDVIQ